MDKEQTGFNVSLDHLPIDSDAYIWHENSKRLDAYRGSEGRSSQDTPQFAVAQEICQVNRL